MKADTTRYDTAMPWTWLEASGYFSLPVFVIVAANIAVFTRMRENVWNRDTVVDGRRVKITALASVWPCVAVDVDAQVPRGELRARRKKVRELEDALRKEVRVSHVQCGKGVVRVVVRPLPLGIRSYDLKGDVVPFVLALEAATAHDGEGGPGGAPVAVRATG